MHPMFLVNTTAARYPITDLTERPGHCSGKLLPIRIVIATADLSDTILSDFADEAFGEREGVGNLEEILCRLMLRQRLVECLHRRSYWREVTVCLVT